ncbi:MAG: RES family NAD+ phosphorylase [Deltaproteobacteria bacterium]|nr:RES family NAD+ phosphorylase [Deltaproteobacteria bacterium]
MPIHTYLKPWTGPAVRHIPKTGDPMDFSLCGRSLEHRWNREGEPTLYLASDKSVVLAEFSRHVEESRTKSLVAKLRDRTIHEYRLKLESTLDLTDAKVVKALSLDPQRSFLDKAICRSTASFIRTTTPAQAIFVPSMAFLDDLAKWCLVLFMEKVESDLGKVFLRVDDVGL